ncbi:bifunctional diguanylate cyclase/phosphodiesterase [Massilia arenosa]|uniref:Bifunctional diguanylate cyclase/phosphodiesterase n=1 Tax=Zemynaea arenosa TaxID=2561931 RepID=A0A4Y9SAB1_9BURK|nr:bifunctional diguanylate cyclase/phosphodiesterase [Massilia arenosa]TFW18544.1 bifunctional diguanylate cyclase/phosphodiesterase [Massilia arenosa]
MNGIRGNGAVAAVLELIGLPACACDPAGVLLAANAELTTLLGYDPEEADLSALITGATPDQLQASLSSSQRWDATLQTASEHIPVSVATKPLPAAEGLAGLTLVFTDVRRYQRDRDALHTTLMEQRAILDNAAVGILFIRARVVRECNLRMAAMLGYAPAELVGLDSAAVFPSTEAFEDLSRAASPPLASGAAYTTELQLKRRDGSLVWCRLNGRAIDTENSGLGTIWIAEDIDEHHRDQDQLRRAMLEMKAIMDNAPVAIGFFRETRVQHYNHQFAQFFGIEGDSGVGSTAREMFPTEAAYRAVLKEAIPRLMQGLPYEIEMEARRRDGSVFWVHAFVYAINPEREAQDTIWILADRTEQKQREEAMRQVVMRQTAILDNASVGIMFSAHGQMITLNPRMAEMFGYARDEMWGQHSKMLFQRESEYDAIAEAAIPVLSAGGLFERHEYQFKRKDGSLFWARVRAKSIDPEQPREGAIWIVEDVTDARRMLGEVQAIMTNASVSILFTRHRHITRYNRGFAEMFGYGETDGLGLPGDALFPSEEAYHAVRSVARPLVAQGKPFQTETEMMRKDGSRLWAQLIGYVVNPEDPAQGVIWMIEDRTEAKRAEESLRNALMENQAILDSAVLGISVVEHGRNLRCNAKMEELFGYGPGEIPGLPVRALYADEATWKAAREEVLANFNAGQISMSEFELVRKDGSRFWARLSGRPFDLSQPRGRSVWLVDDVTQRREAEEAIRRARDELELRVAERTAELAGANAQLQAEIVERRQAEARVHHMAYHDNLTGLPNRALLADRLDRAFLAVQRSDRKLAVMFLDLDRFKTINDSLGHHMGDQLLKEVASRLCRAVRASDTVARLGGDEFVVLVPGIRAIDECAHVAEKIIDALAAPFPLEGRMLHITPSIGICVCPDDGADVETLMRHADAAMYHAKASGRNNYQFFNHRLNVAAAQHFETESNLRSALVRKEFELFYQPIVDIGTRRVRALEVLLRWRRPHDGIALPDQFIPILEENGQIVPVGEWVIRTACEQIVQWQRAGRAVVPLAINLSARQFMHRGLVDAIEAIIADTGVPPALLEFEITETAIMQHGEQTLAVLDRIDAMGIRLSIDDFGTGYSSLAYLKRFPVAKIKIDRAFVRELEDSAEDRAIVDAIVALSSSLELEVVAEGVETEGQFNELRARGCHLVQGYLFSEPIPADAVVELLHRPA